VKNAAVIFVSHSIPQITKICTRGILLHRGRVQVASEQLETVIDGYFNECATGGTVQVAGSGELETVRVRAISAAPPGCVMGNR
jgi:lipopolysaccharide transport system ATP-binding protein